jgi:hypothetical protein
MAKKPLFERGTMTLEQFKAAPVPDAWAALRSLSPANRDLLMNCKSFDDCHPKVRELTGIWIEELVPIFQKLDACLAAMKTK